MWGRWYRVLLQSRSRSVRGVRRGSAWRDGRLVRAIFADGGAKAMNEFTEIFRNETKAKPRKKDIGIGLGRMKPDVKVNVDEGEFADYYVDDDDDDDDDAGNDGQTIPVASPPANNAVAVADSSTPLGGIAALALRQRLLALLTAVSDRLPHIFLPIPALYDLYLDHLRPLPVPTFQLLTSPTALPYFSPVARSSLNQFILRSLITTAAPVPGTDDLSQELWERCFAPWAANTGGLRENACVAVLVEGLGRLLDAVVGVRWSVELEAFVERGIEERERRVGGAGGRGGRRGVGRVEEVEARLWLEGSKGRLRAWLEMLRERQD